MRVCGPALLARPQLELRRGLQDHLADARAFGDETVRLGRLRERDHAVDEHAEASFGGRLEAVIHVRVALSGPAHDRDVIEIKMAHIHRHDAAAVASRGDEPSAAAKRHEGFREEVGIADILEHDVDARAAGDAHRIGGEIGGAVVDAGVAAQFHRRPDAVVRARRDDDPGAQIFRGLDRSAAEAAGGAHHQHPFAGRDLRLVAQHAEGERRVPRHHRGGCEIDVRGDDVGAALGQDHVFGIAAPDGEAEDHRRPARRHPNRGGDRM